MFIIWRGYGFLVPLVLIASFVGVQLSLNAIYGEGFYQANQWGETLAILISVFVIGLFGYLLNYKKRKVLINPETGEQIKSPSHTLFFIPIQYWTLIILCIFFGATGTQEKRNSDMVALLEKPVIDDIYLVDFTKIFKNSDNKYKYGTMKVVAISDTSVDVIMSKMAYDKKSGAEKDIKSKKTDHADHYFKEISSFSIEQLMQLKETKAIITVYRWQKKSAKGE